jgi:hypothetical protein
MREPKAGDFILIAHRIRSVGNGVAIVDFGGPLATINLQPVPHSDGGVWVLTGLATTDDERKLRGGQ